MLVVADMHVHLYACYNLLQAFMAAALNQERLLSQARRRLKLPADTPCAKFLFLTERSDCHFFSDLKRQRILLPGLEINALEEEQVLLVRGQEELSFCLVAGRQIITKEKLEVLALGTDADIPSGLSAGETISLAVKHAALPVLNWAPGKWWFRRGRVVSALLEQREIYPALAVCDITLRPQQLPRPRLMKTAAAGGLKVLAGSDPLPLAAEENLIGSYGIALQGNIEEQRPLHSFFRLINEQRQPPLIVGRRSSLPHSIFRLARLNLDA